jgi:hypothetical protein
VQLSRSAWRTWPGWRPPGETEQSHTGLLSTHTSYQYPSPYSKAARLRTPIDTLVQLPPSLTHRVSSSPFLCLLSLPLSLPLTRSFVRTAATRVACLRPEAWGLEVIPVCSCRIVSLFVPTCMASVDAKAHSSSHTSSQETSVSLTQDLIATEIRETLNIRLLYLPIDCLLLPFASCSCYSFPSQASDAMTATKGSCICIGLLPAEAAIGAGTSCQHTNINNLVTRCSISAKARAKSDASKRI